MPIIKKLHIVNCLLVSMAVLVTDLAYAKPNNMITATAMGEIKLGMTVSLARKMLAPLKLTRCFDGEGVALICAKNKNQEIIVIYAGEADPTSKINGQAKIQQIQVWDPSYQTVQGVHVGMLLQEVELRYGKLKRIQRSEIEAREYATFLNQPKGITLRISGKNGSAAGLYQNDNTEAASYSKGAYIMSISIG